MIRGKQPELPQKVAGFRSTPINQLIDCVSAIWPRNTPDLRYEWRPDGAYPFLVDDNAPVPIPMRLRSFGLVFKGQNVVTIKAGNVSYAGMDHIASVADTDLTIENDPCYVYLCAGMPKFFDMGSGTMQGTAPAVACAKTLPYPTYTTGRIIPLYKLRKKSDNADKTPVYVEAYYHMGGDIGVENPADAFACWKAAALSVAIIPGVVFLIGGAEVRVWNSIFEGGVTITPNASHYKHAWLEVAYLGSTVDGVAIWVPQAPTMNTGDSFPAPTYTTTACTDIYPIFTAVTNAANVTIDGTVYSADQQIVGIHRHQYGNIYVGYKLKLQGP